MICAVGLYAPQKDSNIGGVLRAAHCLDARMVALCGGKYQREAADTTAAQRHVPVIHTDDLLAVAPLGAVPVAVEIVDEAGPLTTFQHPRDAYYLFGPENGTLPSGLIERCGMNVVVIPSKHCLNLAMSVSIVLYDRILKLHRAERLLRRTA